LRELLPAGRRPARGLWAAGCRAVNRLPGLRLDPLAPFRAAIAWNARALEAMVPTPAFVDVALERVIHSVPRYGDIYARVEREPSDRPEVVFLGRVTPYKGLAIAIEALGLLRERHGIAARLEVIGPEEPDHGRELRALARRLGLEAEVGWRGPLTPEQAAAALARAHAIVVPSDWEEPFPLVTIEAALARVPIVAADVGGIGEGMHDEEHALLFPRGDPAAAATALARALQDGEGTAARVRRAFERAQDFRLGPYLDAQERFVVDALEALAAGGRAPLRSSLR
jgi:glycosyltransferase involved in cell wall biosynthesis